VNYIKNITLVANEMWRCLKPDGTLWLNIGDTFNTRTIIRPSSHQGGLGHDNESIRLSWAQARDLGLVRYSARQPGLKDKDLMGLPWRVANALVDCGWYLRADIIWSKPSCGPENAPDRPRRMHEYVFMFTKSSRSRYRRDREVQSSSVWTIQPVGSGGAHTAAFPDDLVSRCILPSTDVGDVVADPFGGSGTTARVAQSLGRVGWSLDIIDWSVR
jgi:DNA modification methylase